MEFVVGVDVGTASVRAGVVDTRGGVIASHTVPIDVYNPSPNFYEQSSTQIWSSVCTAVRHAVTESKVDVGRIRGIAFDATCSLVLVDGDGKPVSVSESGDDDKNVVLWMDHRAMEETAHINASAHELLKFVGGRMSVEMEPPKLMWLKKHLPDSWKRAARFMDLADFLAFQASGQDVRSVCTTTCKWTYHSDSSAEAKSNASTAEKDGGSSSNALSRLEETGWSTSFWKMAGLGELCDEHAEKIGRQIGQIGAKIGPLTQKAAAKLGLSNPGVIVSVGLIDAHSGGVGMLGAELPDDLKDVKLHERLALISGTSTCHMALCEEEILVPGVWGPYYSAMVPGYHLLEGGQSATGKLLDFLIDSSDCSSLLKEESERLQTSKYDVLNRRLKKLASNKGLHYEGFLTADLHILPYFHGNRAPRADSTLLGAISGLGIHGNEDLDALALKYLAAIQALCYGSKHIIDTLKEGGVDLKCVFVCGGLMKNPLFVQQHTDIVGLPSVLPKFSDTVLLGAAVVAAAGSGIYASIPEAMRHMNHAREVVRPTQSPVEGNKDVAALSERISKFQEAKYRVFHKMYEHFQELRSEMQDFVL